ncbi:MAG: hypothetical protein ACRC1K_00240, partial [Planctomycetia bacterium]
ANRDGEDDLRRLASTVQKWIPPAGLLHTVQSGRVKNSVYPIAALYYGRRSVRAVQGLPALEELTAAGGSVFYIVAEESQVEALRRAMPTAGVETVERSGRSVFARVVPPHLQTAVRGAKNLDR